MVINNFSIYNNGLIVLITNNDEQVTLWGDNNSGKLVYRKKGATIFNVQHTGIYIGKDEWGRSYIAHSHIDNGQAVLDSVENFSKGYTVYEDNKECVNTPFEIVNKALDAIILGAQYLTLLENCQHFVSDACNNIKESLDVQRITTSVTSIGVGAYMLKSKNGFVNALGVLAILFGLHGAVRQPYNGEQASFL